MPDITATISGLGVPGTPGKSLLVSTGIPDNGVGANGDRAIDRESGLIYAKSAGAWASTETYFLSPHLETVAGLESELEALAPLSGNIVTLAGLDTELAALAPIAADISSVAAVADGLGDIITNLATISSVADNIDDILAVEGLASQVAADAVATAADRVQTGLDVAATAADRIQTGADVLTTAANRDVSTADKNAAAISADVAEAAAAGAIATKALMDTELTNVENYDNTLAQLSPAAKEIVAAADVVDVFIYDTTLDSDGGAWRKRCNWTSWFKETLNTATRGVRNQFPSKALIVARNTGGTGQIVIYDLDQASCPMWMVFNIAVNGMVRVAGVRSIAALNGCLYVGTPDNADGFVEIDFILDRAFKRRTTAAAGAGGETQVFPAGLSLRNAGTSGGTTNLGSTGAIVNALVYDVAATVLPGTPIDRRRRLPTPTVAVATAGGISVIHWDGRVANSAETYAVGKTAFAADGSLIWMRSADRDVNINRPQEYLASGFATRRYRNDSVPALLTNISPVICPADRNKVGVAGSAGLSLLNANPAFTTGTGSVSAPGSAVAYLTSKYSTGYMVGDTKLALAESTADLTSLVQGATDFLVGAGTELVTDGSFSAGISQVTAARGAVLTWDGSNRLQVAVGGGSIPEPQGLLTLTTVPGARYKAIIGNINANPSSGIVRALRADGTTTLSSVLGVTGAQTLYFTALDTTTYLALSTNSSAPGASTYFDNISVKEVVTTVLYEDFGGYADTPAAVAAGWSLQADLSVSGGKFICTAASATRGGYKAASMAPGLYRVQYDIDSISGGGLVGVELCNDANGSNGLGPVNSSTAGTKTVYFMVTSQTGLRFRLSAGTTAKVDNVRIDRVASDRSIAGNHPLVYGTVTRTAVATGAELAAYGGFSASNDIRAPYSGAFDVGVGDFHYSAWVNASTLTNGRRIIERQKPGGPCIVLFQNAVGITGYCDTNSAGGSSVSITTPLITVGQWYKADFLRRNGVLELWANGVLIGTAAFAGTLTNTSADIIIGNTFNTTVTRFWLGSIALPRISVTAPTPQQIRDMYEAEKVLFQSNAKCLLPADSVSALSYDDSTDLLHVATTSGMARLKDLLVVDKDSIVVTGIDAKSGIVVTRDTGSADAVLPAKLLREELLAPQPVALYDRDKVKGSGVTTNATPTIIGRIPFDKGEFKIADVRVKANQYADGAGYGRYVRRVLVDRPEEGNIALAGSVETIGTDAEGTGTQDIGLTVNTTTQTLDITATGLASTNIEWTWEAVLS